MEDRRRTATRLVSLSLAATGVLFLAGGVWMTTRGGAASVATGVFVILLGLITALAGFFFLLVPHRLDDLRAMQQEYEAEHGPYKEE